METAVSSNTVLPTCGRQSRPGIAVHYLRHSLPSRASAVLRKSSAHWVCSSRSAGAEVSTLRPPQEETQVSQSFWDDGRSLVVALPLPEPQISEGVLEQPLIQPEAPTEHREVADIIERRPGTVCLTPTIPAIAPFFELI